MHTRTCGQQIADRSLPVAEMLFRIGTLSRWVRAAASPPPGFDPAVRGGLGENPPTAAGDQLDGKRFELHGGNSQEQCLTIPVSKTQIRSKASRRDTIHLVPENMPDVA